MKKIKSFLLATVAVITLSSCGGSVASEEELTDERLQQIVDSAIGNYSIMTMDSFPVTEESGEEISLIGDENNFVVLSTSFLVEGKYQVAISWTPNMRNAFKFSTLESGHIEAKPNYPEVGMPDRAYSLTATAKFRGVESDPKTYLFRVVAPTKVANKISLLEAHTATSGQIIWIEGQVTRILLGDYNSAYILDENGVGFSLYHIDFSSEGKVDTGTDKRLIQIGDYVKVVGPKGAYNEQQQVGNITLLELTEKPADFPETLPVHELTEDFFKMKDKVLPGFEESGYDGQSSLVKVEGLKFDHWEDRNGEVIDNAAALKVVGTENHLNAVALLGETEVLISFNYHMGTDCQREFINFLVNLKAGETFNYKGVLGMYSGLNLQPMASGDLYK